MARNLPYASDVDANYYYAIYADVAAAGVPAARHYHFNGWHEGRNPNEFFDTLGYLTTYQDVAAAGIDPLAHFHNFGFREGRTPSPAFDGNAYLAANPDVAAYGYDPLAHYLRFGRAEGRQAIAKPLVDVDGAGNAVAEHAAAGTGTGVTFSWGGFVSPNLHYVLTGDTSGGGFAVDANTGRVYVVDASKIDYAGSGPSHSYTVTVTASDLGHTISQSAVIAVGDVNPTAPVDSDTTTANRVTEGAAAGTYTGLTVASSDNGSGPVTYSLTDDAGGRFALDANHRVIVSAAGAGTIDYESAPGHAYSVTVGASDGATTTTQTFSIAVTDAAPAFNTPADSNAAANQAASRAAQGSPTGLQASAADPNGGTVTYSLANDDGGHFQIDGGSGIVTVGATPPVYDGANPANNTRTITVKAADPSGQSATQTFTIAVTNAPPVIDSNGGGDTATVPVKENTTEVTTVHAVDPDMGPGRISYSIVGGAGSPDAAKFTIDTAGALSFITAPDYEAPGSAAHSNTYTVQVAASDGAATDTQTITVNVTNVNEAPTATVPGAQTTAEDMPKPIGGVSVADVDSASLTTTLLVDHGSVTVATGGGATIGGNGTPGVTVSGTADQINTALAGLTYTPTADYNGPDTLRVQTSDGQLATTSSVGINVTAVNDAPINHGVPSSIQTQSGVAYAITGLSISDVDAGTATDLTTTFAATQGTAMIDTVAGGAAITGNGTGTVTLKGSIAQINASLGGHVTYTAPDGVASPTTTTLKITTDDAGHTGVDPGLTGTATSEADVDTIKVGVTPQVWFIDSTPDGADATAPRGSQANPFTSIGEFNTASTAAGGPGVNDYIYLKDGTYTGPGINLKDGQVLLGDDQPLSFTNPLDGSPIVIETASGGRPVINVTTAGDQGIDLASGNTVRGIDILTGAGTTGLGSGTDADNNVGTLTVSKMSISGAGQAVFIDQGGNLAVAIDSLSSTGGRFGVELYGSTTGSFTAATGSLSNNDVEFYVGGSGDGDISYGGTIGAGRGYDVFIAGLTGGSVTLSGDINDGSANGGGIVVAGNSGGTITFSGATKVLNTNYDDGVDLFNNARATINFTNGGLDIHSTRAHGFAADYSGTINVTGPGNIITSTFGVGLEVIDTKIGADNLTFQSISSDQGSYDGIRLDDTGTAGGLHVTGTGATAGSGGTIANNTSYDGNPAAGTGIYLNKTSDVQLANMNLHDFSNFAIRGHEVTGLTLTGLVVSGTNGTSSSVADALAPGAAPGEDAIRLTNLHGTNTISNSQISGGRNDQLHVENTSGDLAQLTLTNNTVTGSDGGKNGVSIVADAGTSMKVTATGNTLSHAAADNFGVTGGEGSSLGVVFTSNTVTSNARNADGGLDNNGLSIQSAGNFTYNVANNTFAGGNFNAGGHAVDIGTEAHTTTTTSSGTISGNTIGGGDPLSDFVEPIRVDLEGQHIGTVLIQNNGVNGRTGTVSMAIVSGAKTLNATVIGNTSQSYNGSGVEFYSYAGPDSTLNLKLGGSGSEANTFIGGPYDDSAYLGSEGVFNLTRGTSQSSDARQVVADNNVSKPAKTAGTIHVVDSVPAQPQLAAPGGVEAHTATPGETHLTQAQLDSAVASAIDHWAAAGANASQIAMLKATSFHVADLVGDTIGQASPGQVTIDTDAAGHGWYIDLTPNDNFEFAHAAGATKLTTDPDAAPAGHLDLLTTVMHEMGHVIGLPDGEGPADGLMHGTLQDGTRLLASAGDVAAAHEAMLPPAAQAANGTPILLGTAGADVLHAGANILFGGQGADTFVFDKAQQPGTMVTHVADYSAAQGDVIDVSALAAGQAGASAAPATFRVAADTGGAFATLQQQTFDAKGTTHWTDVAQLDGVHAGDQVDVVQADHAIVHLHAGIAA